MLGERLDLQEGRQEGRHAHRLHHHGVAARPTRGKMFIDATYEGDLMAKAGVSYHVGREANKIYGETLNGVQVEERHSPSVRQERRPVRQAGRSDERPAAARPRRPARRGRRGRQARAGVQLPLCATDRPENRRPWPKPANYDEKQYELLLRNFEAGDLRLPWNPVADAQPQDRHEQQLRLLAPTTSA